MGRRKKEDVAASAPLDLSSLTVEDSDVAPVRKRTSKVLDTPFVGWLWESYENVKPKSVTVPESNVGEVTYLIRAASNKLEIGARVQVVESGIDGYSKVIFLGKDRRQRRTKDEMPNESTPATDD